MISPQELKEFGTYGLVPKRGTINPEDVWQTVRKKARRRHARPQNEFLVQARLCSLDENNGRKTRVHSTIKEGDAKIATNSARARVSSICISLWTVNKGELTLRRISDEQGDAKRLPNHLAALLFGGLDCLVEEDNGDHKVEIFWIGAKITLMGDCSWWNVRRSLFGCMLIGSLSTNILSRN